MKRKKGNAAAVRPEHEYNSGTKLWTQIYRQEAPIPNKQWLQGMRQAQTKERWVLL